MSAPLHVFTDFDGTITDRDTLVFLTGRFGGGERMVEVNNRLLREGKISIRQCIAADMRSIRVPFADAVAALRAEIHVDPAFPAFVRWCTESDVPLTVLSAGFEDLVRLFLPPADFPGLDVRANRLRFDQRIGWQCDFRDRSEFGHDKAVALREAQRSGRRAVFIGDGISDRAPARVADEVFAKRDLAAFCRDHGVACTEIQGFDDVLRHLTARLRGV